MSIATIEAQFVSALASVVSTAIAANGLGPWPIRWPNDAWIIGVGGLIALNNDNAPVDGHGNPAPFIEAEVIAGNVFSSIAPAGQRQSFRTGLCRVYLVAPLGSGRVAVNTLADALIVAFSKQTIYYNPPERLTTMDARVDDHLAEHLVQTNVRIDAQVPAPWKGDRYVRPVVLPWFFDFMS